MATIEEVLTCRDRWLHAVATARAEDAAREALPKCRAAVLELEARLGELGYPVRSFITPAPPDLRHRLEPLEAATGVRVPAVLREFWRVVGGVSFVDLRDYKHVEFWDSRGIMGPHGFGDGFHVDAPDEGWIEYAKEGNAGYLEEGDLDSFWYELAPDGYHKDNISGGPPYAVGRGSDWAPVWEEFAWLGYRRPETALPGATDFLSYVRTTLLECAGFPGFLGHPGFEPLRRTLVDGLIAF